MPKGYRPDFYNPDPVLHSIELLAWAAGRDSFILRELLLEFASEFGKFVDPSHEASERLRKLLKSGMILVVTPGVLNTFKAAFKEESKAKDPGITKKEIQVLEERLAKIAASKQPGRKPRLYRITQIGLRYAEKRAADLDQIYQKKLEGEKDTE